MASRYGTHKLAAVGIDPGVTTSGISVFTSDGGCVFHRTVTKPFLHDYDAVDVLACLQPYDEIIFAIEKPYDRYGPVAAVAFWTSWIRKVASTWRVKPPTESQSYILHPLPRVWRTGLTLNRLAGEQIKQEATRLALALLPKGSEVLASSDEAESILIARWACWNHKGQTLRRNGVKKDDMLSQRSFKFPGHASK